MRTPKIINSAAPGGIAATPWRLYDLSVDPGEHGYLAAKHPEFLEELVAEWRANWQTN